MDISPNIRERIFTAAAALYEEAGHRAFPTVDAVRKLAKVNMNDASNGMKAWRRSQTIPNTPAVQVPNALQQTSIAALAALWSEAVALANETLHSAQIAWEDERAEVEALREQMASAYEVQATELEAAHANVARLLSETERANDASASMRSRMEDALRQVAIANAATKHAEVKSLEIERRADELRKELDHAHEVAADTAKEVTNMRLFHADEIAGVRAEMAQTRKKAELDEVSVRAALSQAHELAATLRGKLDTLTEQKAAKAIGKPRSKKTPDDSSSNSSGKR